VTEEDDSRDRTSGSDAAALAELASPPALSLQLPAEPGQLAVLRRELRPWLRAYGLDEHARNDVLVAVGEAAANAIEHPHDPRHPSFVVAARVEGDELVVLVSDSGEWREPSRPTERGRGVPFMRELMSEVVVRKGASGTEVTLRRRLPFSARANAPSR
jgi:anti-sigma regulatory factor (Ser/Thr protein kinase)